MNYAPKGKPAPVVKPGEFVFSAVRLDHGHIYGMCNGLTEAGGTLKYVYDPDPKKVEAFVKAFPSVTVARTEAEALEDKETRLIAGAAVTSERCALGLRAIAAGKDYFTDKAPLTTMEQLVAAKKATAETGLKYMCYYGERLHNGGALFAQQLIEEGAIGRCVSVAGFGPHRLSAPSRPAWFFEREKFGGILCDIGSHQIEQYLTFCGEEDATVDCAHIANYNNPQYPEFEDFGDAVLTGKNGTNFYFRVDWFTPDGMRTWGDGRTLVIGTEGTIEIRKYINVGVEPFESDVVNLVNGKKEERYSVAGKVGYPYFGQLILDCLNRTETAMTQAHCFKAAELGVIAQDKAIRIYG
jgi:predicted dehydrogenase